MKSELLSDVTNGYPEGLFFFGERFERSDEAPGTHFVIKKPFPEDHPSDGSSLAQPVVNGLDDTGIVRDEDSLGRCGVVQEDIVFCSFGKNVYRPLDIPTCSC